MRRTSPNEGEWHARRQPSRSLSPEASALTCAGGRIMRARDGAHPVRGQGRAHPTIAPLDEPSFSLNRGGLQAMKGDSYARPSTPRPSRPGAVQEAGKGARERLPAWCHIVVDGFTGLNWAATRGRFDVVRLFLARGASPDIRNSYDGTALGAALWGAVNRGHNADDVPVIETLVSAGARVEPALVDWWRHQRTQAPDVHARILSVLAQHVARS